MNVLFPEDNPAGFFTIAGCLEQCTVKTNSYTAITIAIRICLLATAILLSTVGGSARAALSMDGSLGVAEFSYGGAFTSSSLVLNPSTMIIFETGTFSSLVPNLSELTSYTGTLTGLSSAPTTENIDNFFTFSTPNSLVGASGTTPNNRFEFDLNTLSEAYYNGQFADYVGVGTLVDSLGTYASSPAQFDLSFSAEGNYSFVLSTVAIPEPYQYGICGGVFALLAVLLNPVRRNLNIEQ
jgi:hypothetical protein